MVVTREDAVAGVRALAGAMPGMNSRVTAALDRERWQDADCLWVHDVSPISPDILPWIRAGGRLLATLGGVQVAVALGVESVPPDDVRDSLWKDDPSDPAPRGLAGFGPHPLFADLQQGCTTWVPRPGAPYRWAAHLASRPATAAVIAVERRDLSLNPSRIVAWEYAVGDGGILCIGSGIYPEPADQPCAPQLRTLLRNALVGQGIPHRERVAPAACWPAPGTQVLRSDLTPVPELSGLAGDWPEATSVLVTEFPSGSPSRWRLAGRRASLEGGDAHGLREAWVHPFSVARDVEVSVGGAPLAGSSASRTPDDVVRRSTAGGASVVERWMVALEHPVVYWEITAAPESAIHLAWTTDVRRAWPYPAGGGGDLELSVAPDGHHAVLGARGESFRLIVEVEGGTLQAAPADGPAVRFSVRGMGRCRVRLTGAADAGDLERSREMLARRGVAGLWRQRGDHARALATYATSIETPEPPLTEAFEWAKVEMDSALTGTPGVGRCLAVASAGPDRPGGAWYAGPHGCLRALAQLAVGDRAGPRDTLKFLSLTQDVDGHIVEGCSTGGLASFGTTPAIPLYLLLAARYASWTGELEFLAQRWVSIRRAFEVGLVRHPWLGEPGSAAAWSAALEALLPLAEALGHPESAEVLSAAAAAARPMGGAATFHAGPWGLLDFQAGRFQLGLEEWRRLSADLRRVAAGSDLPAAVGSLAIEGLWGVRPNALEGAVQLAPWFPADWEEMAVERLRVGRTVLTVRLRRRFGQVAGRVERVHGPRIHVEFELRGTPMDATVQVDDVELRGGRVAFEADGTHALAWHF